MKGNKSYIIIGIFLFLIIGGVYGYFGILSPLHQKITAVDAEMKQQKTFLDNTKTPIAEVTSNYENTSSLQEEVPVKALVDQLILQFEKAEVLSDSLIMSMDFSDGEASEDEEVVETTEETSNNEETGETAPTDNNTAAEEGNDETDNPEEDTAEVPVTPEVLPQGVKKITAEMSVVSKDYKGLVKFLRTIEELKRITVIEAITFSGLDELEMAAEEVTANQLTYEITISAYYLPELTDYLEDLPKGEFPAPEGKENPLTGGDKKEE